ncbi:MAG TPA: hypothetical protein ENN60_01635, partial [archaeon]|nr:hypothetical protein [archaeon]
MANVTVYATEFDIISPGVVENPSELVRQALDAMNPVRPGRYMVTLHDSRPAYRQVHSSQLGPAFFQLIREHVPEPYFSGFLRISTPNDFSLDALIDFLNGDLCITYQ